MIGKTEREDRMYEIKLRQIITYAFIKARGNGGRIYLHDLYIKFSGMDRSEIVSFMNEPILKEMFARRITGDGIIYCLTGKFRYVEYDTVNKFMNNTLKKDKEESKN